MGISFNQVPKSSRLLLDYLYSFDRIAGFYNGSPFMLSSYQSLADRLPNSSASREALTRILEQQNRAFGSTPAVFENVAKLRQPETFAVVTGQQVGLFGGPAFTIYKALTAVRLAQWLSDQGLPSVPVFWLATEDHDLEEVARTVVFDENYQLVPLENDGERPAPRSPVGRVKLTNGVTETLKRLETTLPVGPGRDPTMRDLRESYVPGRTWGEAFGQLMARLFGRWGVILVDALDRELHQLSSHIYGLAIEQAASIRQKLLERSRALVRCGYHAQVHVAEDDTLLFLLTDGDRLPLHQTGGGFARGTDQKLSDDDLKNLLAAHPDCFSANALMRPIVQDTLFPTIAYIAGPSELAYLGQSHAIYQVFGRPMPVVFPRAGFTLADRKTQRFLEKYNVSVEDVWQGEEHLNRKLADGSSGGWAERFDMSERELAALLERLRIDIEHLDPTLLDTLKHAEEKMKYQLERLRGKLSRAAVQRSDLIARHHQILRRFLFPENDLQERQVCGAYFLARAGYELLDQLLDRIPVDSADHQVVVY